MERLKTRVRQRLGERNQLNGVQKEAAKTLGYNEKFVEVAVDAYIMRVTGSGTKTSMFGATTFFGSI
eukprot:768089-Hanusia_phi.AAC.3